MSHFAVGVLHREDQNIEDLLTPYSENIAVDPYIRYTREQAIAKVREDGHDDWTDDQCFEYFAEDYDEQNVDEQGNIWSMYNPKSKWDWWCIGGRFDGFKVKGSDYAHDEAKVCEIDFSPDESDCEYYRRFWEVNIEGKPLSPDEDKDNYFAVYNNDYYTRFYSDKEDFVKRKTQFLLRAIITPDGEWHERGEMGWFGVSSENPEEARDWDEHFKERYIDTAEPDWILTLVDCHI